MQTIAQALASRFRFATMLARAVGAVPAIDAKAWAMDNIALPAVAGGMLALPDLRPLRAYPIKYRQNGAWCRDVIQAPCMETAERIWKRSRRGRPYSGLCIFNPDHLEG